MNDLKSLIRQKSKASIIQHEALSQESAVDRDGITSPGHLSTHTPHYQLKKLRTRINDRSDEVINIEDFILRGSGTIPDDIVLSREDGHTLDSYMEDMNLIKKIDRETDRSRIMRCREAVKAKLSDDKKTEESPPNNQIQGDSSENVVLSIDESWEKLQMALVRASRAPTFYKWLRSTFTDWLPSLTRSSGSVKQETDSNAFIQSCHYMEDLISDIEHDKLDLKFRQNLDALAEKALNQEFLAAEEAYMRIAVGNQTWLIGVGNCFIQERSSLDRIREAKHIMNDEHVRNYIQCLKRLITIDKQFHTLRIDP